MNPEFEMFLVKKFADEFKNYNPVPPEAEWRWLTLSQFCIERGLKYDRSVSNAFAQRLMHQAAPKRDGKPEGRVLRWAYPEHILEAVLVQIQDKAELVA